jgi:hypothetical protein
MGRGRPLDRSNVWIVDAAELRLMAATAEEPERKRKLLALADQFEESARRLTVGRIATAPDASARGDR